MSEAERPDFVALMQLIVAAETTIERIHTLALEWHGKHITDARFSIRVYEILRQHEQEVAALETDRK